uniref:60S ribosomal protein L41 n=1 Tax=Cyprinus carpio TaxID=7962 RepID=A0A8C1EXM2_CYPCA
MRAKVSTFFLYKLKRKRRKMRQRSK